MVVNLNAIHESGLVEGEAARAVDAMADGTLNNFLALGSSPRRGLRKQLFAMFSERASEQRQIQGFLYPASDCEALVPTRISNYTAKPSSAS